MGVTLKAIRTADGGEVTVACEDRGDAYPAKNASGGSHQACSTYVEVVEDFVPLLVQIDRTLMNTVSNPAAFRYERIVAALRDAGYEVCDGGPWA